MKKRTEKRKKPASAGTAGHGGAFCDRPLLHVALVAALGLMVYSNTFHVPFVFDDESNIVNNPAIRGFGYFLEPSTAERAMGGNIAYTFRTRYVGYLTFALNYRLGGLDVAGYHAFNLAVHILNALLLYWLMKLTLRTPYFGRGRANAAQGCAPLLAALLFVAHPVQTQAVTYVVQRFASLMATFSLFSLVMYIKARAAGTAKGLRGYYAISLLAAALAMKTKENAFTLPFMAALYESMFFKGEPKKRALFLLPMALTLLIIPLALLGASSGKGGLGDALGAIASSDAARIAHGDYLLTQLRVIATYIRLLFVPYSQNVDYGYPIYGSVLSPGALLSTILHLALVGFAVYLYRRPRGGAGLRLVSFGIFWFYIALSVESGAAPIADVIFEHRVYLPSAGAFIALATAASMAAEKLPDRSRRAAAAAAAALLLVFSLAAYNRNAVWGSELGLWEDTVRKSPGKARPHNNLGKLYGERGHLDQAEKELKSALSARPDYADAHSNLGNVYDAMGRYEEAIAEFREAIRIRPNDADAHNNLGIVYDNTGRYEDAEREYAAALSLAPGMAEAHNNLGTLYYGQGRFAEAEAEFRAALSLKPENADFRENLSRARDALGR